jgi:hypothetical protein
MRETPTSHKLVSPHGTPKKTEPHEGHAGTKYEGTDATAGIVLWSLAVIGGTLVVVFAMTIWIQRYLQERNPPGELPSPLAPARIVAPSPQIQVHPWEDLPDLRAHEDQVLNGYSKDADGHMHIPIARAMDAVVSQLNIRAGSAQGITTPGGEGREFSHGLTAMPAPYQRPAEIQGEIRKNAQ